MQFVCSIIIGVARSLITQLNKKRKKPSKGDVAASNQHNGNRWGRRKGIKDE